MVRRIPAACALVLIAAALLCTACVDDARRLLSPAPEPGSQVAAYSAGDSLVPSDSNNEGHLEHVVVIGSPKIDLKLPDGGGNLRDVPSEDRVEVRVPDSVRGVVTYLTVQMSYGPLTMYALDGKPASTLSEAVTAGSSFWSLTDADITYHLEDGHFVLDSIGTRQPFQRSPYLPDKLSPKPKPKPKPKP